MATVQVNIQLEPGFNYQQKAPSQSARTAFTPGKASSRANDANWPVDFHTYVGIPIVDAHMNADKFRQTRVDDIKALNSCEEVLPTPTNDPYYPTNPIHVVVQLNEENDVPVIKTDYLETETKTQKNTGDQTKKIGSVGFIP